MLHQKQRMMSAYQLIGRLVHSVSPQYPVIHAFLNQLSIVISEIQDCENPIQFGRRNIVDQEARLRQAVQT
jgi:hypothetical protein